MLLLGTLCTHSDHLLTGAVCQKVVICPTWLCFTVTLIVLGPAVSSRLTSCCYIMLNEALAGCISQLKDHALIVVWYSGPLPGGPLPPSSTAIILLLGGLVSLGSQVKKQAKQSPEGFGRAAPEVFIRQVDDVLLSHHILYIWPFIPFEMPVIPIYLCSSHYMSNTTVSGGVLRKCVWVWVRIG